MGEKGGRRSDIAAAHPLFIHGTMLILHLEQSVATLNTHTHTQREKDRKTDEKKQISCGLSSAAFSVPTGK